MRSPLLLSFLLLAGSAVAADPAAGDLAARVVVLANAADPESVGLARFYAAQRGVPEANLLALPMPRTESVTWREFVDQVFQPVQDELVRRGWINALPSTLLDALGRRRYSVLDHRIAYLVVCRGVPLRIHHDPTIVDGRRERQVGAQFRTNQAAVDSELSLLAQSGTATLAYVPNPLHAQDRPSALDEEMVVKVSRLDGPAAEDARRLVLSALEAEKHGLIGRYYVDLGGPHADGDGWLRSVREQLDNLGFDGDVETTGATFGPGVRFDAPVLYFGWYAGDLNGPFARPRFRFPPGAIALHIHSYSAQTLHSAGGGWTGPLVARGAAATVGNVFEPYLQLTHRPNLLLRALAQGRTFGDAAYYALPALSWQAIAVGDPLYRPFQVPLERQLADVAALPATLGSQVVIRQANLLQRRGRGAEATALLQRRMLEAPTLSVQLALARAQEAAGDRARAVRTLEPARYLREFPRDNWTIGREIARQLAAWGEADAALAVCRTLVADGAPVPAARLELLAEARRLADQAGELARSIEFGRLLAEAEAAAETAEAERK